jgi:hypothetical protein
MSVDTDSWIAFVQLTHLLVQLGRLVGGKPVVKPDNDNESGDPSEPKPPTRAAPLSPRARLVAMAGSIAVVIQIFVPFGFLGLSEPDWTSVSSLAGFDVPAPLLKAAMAAVACILHWRVFEPAWRNGIRPSATVLKLALMALSFVVGGRALDSALLTDSSGETAILFTADSVAASAILQLGKRSRR